MGIENYKLLIRSLRNNRPNLILTYHWYDEIASGRKHVEYRAMSDKWMRDIWNKRHSINAVRFQRGYTKTAMIVKVERIDLGPCPYEGWDGEYIRIHLSRSQSTTIRKEQ